MNLQIFFEDFLKKKLELTKHQFDAVMGDKERDRTAYRLLITAPAGSGKTRVLASRYLKLLVDGEKPENIVAITFTRKAAGEMKERIVDFLQLLRKEIIKNNISCELLLILKDDDALNKLILGMRIATIDAFLSRIIRLFPGESGVNPNFRVIDEIEEEELIDSVIDELIEGRLEQDRGIIKLLRFFNFRYSTEYHNQFYFLNSVKRIVKNWGMLSETISTLSQKSQEDLSREIKRYIGKEINAEKRFNELVKKVKELREVYNDSSSPYNDFIEFITSKSIEELIKNEDKFMSFINLFYTKDKHLRKKPVTKIKDTGIKELLRAIAILYERCVLAFAFNSDIEHTNLALNFIELIITIVERLKKRKKELGVLGMGDLKTVTYQLLIKHKERFNILYNMDARVNHYLIDEFQDTDPIQWEIFNELTRDWFSGETAKQELNILPTIFLVGDEKQSIYGFRNADVSIINSIKEKEDPFKKKFSLVENFRSKKEIVQSVNLLFKDKMKRLEERPFSVRYEEMKSKDEEGGGTVKIIESLIKGNKQERIPLLAEKIAGLILSLKDRYKSWGDIALLFRDSLNFHFYEKVFEEKGIPYISSGGKSFFENREIKEILKILAFLENPYDDINFSSLFLSPLFNHNLNDLMKIVMTTSETIEDSEGFSLYDKLKRRFREEYRNFLDLTTEWLNNRDRISTVHLIEKAIIDTNAYGILVVRKGGQKDVNIKKLLNLIANISEEKMNFCFFFEKLNRVIKAREKNADIDIGTQSFEREETGALHIMTVHKAKGLEFPVVILPEVDSATIKRKGDGVRIDRDKTVLLFLKKYKGMDTPLLKRYKEYEMAKEDEELKRLFYVALTRAKEELYLFISDGKRSDTKVWMNIVFDSGLPRTDGIETKIRTEKERIVSPGRENAIYRFTEKKKIVSLKKEIRPSEIEKETVIYNIHNEKTKIKGTILHKLFELLGNGIIKPDLIDKVPLVVANIADQMDDKFICDNNLLNEIEKEFLSVLRNEKIMGIITDEHSLNEFPYSLEKKNEEGATIIINGVMDKVLLGKDEVRVYDFKTDAIGASKKEEFIANMKRRYKKQMDEYRFAAQKLFGKKNIKVFLILTSILEIVEV